MDKDTILDYVTETPGNTNRAVLGSMLDSMGGGEESEAKITIVVGENNNLYLSEEDITFYNLYHQHII